MADPHERARRLARRIVAFADPELRVRYLQHTLRQMDSRDIADVLTVAMHGAEARDGDSGALLLALCLALAQEGAEELREAVVREARAGGRYDTAALLQPRRAERTSEEPPHVPDFGKGRALSLGERKSLARTHDRDLLARVIRDPSPEVIRILLGNPTLTQDLVVRLCARRPVSGDVLRQVFRHTRWVVRYPVRRAMARNPFCPIDIALQLVAHLTGPDARQIVASPELSMPVREACRRVARMGTIH